MSWDQLLSTANHIGFSDATLWEEVDTSANFDVVLPGSMPVRIDLYRYASDSFKPFWHRHDSFEILVVASGECRFASAGNDVGLVSGDLIVMNHANLHFFRGFEGEEARLIVIRLTAEAVRSVSTPLVDDVLLLPFQCFPQGKPHIWRSGEDEIAQLYATTTSLMQSFFDEEESAYREATIKVNLMELLLLLARRFDASGNLLTARRRMTRRSAEHMNKVLNYAQLNYARKISRAQAAAVAGMSESAFQRAFKQAAGTPWHEYLTDLRLSYGARWLRETDIAIAEIAGRIGFSDQSHFNRRFKQRYKCTPREYRELMSGKKDS